MIHISLAHKRDLPKIICIEKESFPKSDRFTKQVFLYHIGKQKLYVAKHDEEIVGYMILIFYKYTVRLYSLAITKKYRRKKYAKLLILKLFKIAKTKAKQSITIEVRVNNKQAISLYQKCGFSIIKKLPAYYEGGIDGYKMQKIL